MIKATDILTLHESTVELWHQSPIANKYLGALSIICDQHARNFELWHQEDIARNPLATDRELAETKRHIDRLNQSRNDLIESIDDWIADWLHAHGVIAIPGASSNSETPGSIIDRLSILSLRIYHMREQLERDDVNESHLARVIQRIAVCDEQLKDLAAALNELLINIETGTKRHKLYRQFKMYNDPTMNPFLYQQDSSRKTIVTKATQQTKEKQPAEADLQLK